jgi:tetratricopeptide (TPR) repeat protein
MKRLCAPALIVLFLLAGCGKKSANEYYAEAEGEFKAAKAAADTLRDREGMAKLFEPALEGYLRLAEEYPDDPLAEEALFRTATIRNNEMRDPEQAVLSYKQYADRYPEAKRAPLATFLAGYLYHNELGRLDSAEAWYRRFLERYPQHEMALSAQFELNSLGKLPEELLPADSLRFEKQGVAAGSNTKKAAVGQH